MTVNMIYNLLGKLENIIIAKGIRLLPLPYAIVNVKNIEDVLDRIRVSIPGEIQEAREILRRKDEILMESQNKADHRHHKRCNNHPIRLLSRPDAVVPIVLRDAMLNS